MKVIYSASTETIRQMPQNYLIKEVAQLISAAPEMYEALNKVIATLAPSILKKGVKKAFHEIVLINEINKIIRKAEGGTK